MEIRYRPFRNSDPPGLVKLWNESLPGPAAAFLQGTTTLETYVFAKRHFEPRGLIVAEAQGELAGFVHAGFGPDAEGRQLDTSTGVICALVVGSRHRRKRIGSGLLRQAESYLKDRGAATLYFGAMQPLNPFYLGLYGGSELPGVLASETCAEPFLRANHYSLWDTCIVLGRSLEPAPVIADARFVGLRRKYELEIRPRPTEESRFKEGVLSPLEMSQFQLSDKQTRKPVARARAWEMDLFAWRRHQASTGIVDVHVEEGHRRQGLAKFLLAQIFQRLCDQFFTQVEVQTMERNAPALSLYRSVGFEKVNEGRVYRLEDQ